MLRARVTGTGQVRVPPNRSSAQGPKKGAGTFRRPGVRRARAWRPSCVIPGSGDGAGEGPGGSLRQMPPPSFLGSPPWPSGARHPPRGHCRSGSHVPLGALLLRARLVPCMACLGVARGLLRSQAPTVFSLFCLPFPLQPQSAPPLSPFSVWQQLSSPLISPGADGAKPPPLKYRLRARRVCSQPATPPWEPRSPAVPDPLCPFLAGSTQDHESRPLQGPSRGEDVRPARSPRPASGHSILLAPRTEGPCLGSSPSERHPQP